jgi:hypothetical protein
MHIIRDWLPFMYVLWRPVHLLAHAPVNLLHWAACLVQFMELASPGAGGRARGARPAFLLSRDKGLTAALRYAILLLD